MGQSIWYDYNLYPKDSIPLRKSDELYIWVLRFLVAVRSNPITAILTKHFVKRMKDRKISKFDIENLISQGIPVSLELDSERDEYVNFPRIRLRWISDECQIIEGVFGFDGKYLVGITCILK